MVHMAGWIMGDIADGMVDGVFCQSCGEFIGPGGGFPRFCSSCLTGSGGTAVRAKNCTVSAALDLLPQVKEILRSCPGLTLKRHDYNRHWQGCFKGKIVAEWWPFTGRLVVLQRYKEKGQFTQDVLFFTKVCKVVAEQMVLGNV